jgi:Xaa-Pro aminopeptidase
MSVFARRASAARDTLRAEGFACLLLGVGPELRWLTGYAPYLLERLTLLLLPAQGRAMLVVPLLERGGAAACPAVRGDLCDLVTWEESDDPYALVAELLPDRARDQRLLVSDQLWAMFVVGLQTVLPHARFGLASEAIRALRMAKDAAERQLLAESASAVDTVFEELATVPLIGRSEADVSRQVKERLAEAGLDAETYAIVASGPNSALPHHAATSRVIAAGEPVMFDIGGARQGYHADATRMMWVTGDQPAVEPDEDYLRLYATLKAAQASARDAVRSGVSCESVDAAARDVITAAGYGPYFTHRTGHGIGLDLHEHPYIVAGNAELLAEGHAFSIEPGIYLDGRYGARIEDIVICEADGVHVLNQVTHELRIVPGI